MLNVVLVRPTIPHNTGCIGRTCLNFGARLHLVGPLGFRLDAKEVKRAGLDYWPHVDKRLYDDWNAFSSTEFQKLKKNVFFLSKFGKLNLANTQLARWSDDIQPGNEAAPPLHSTPRPPMDITLVFGSETNGLYGLIGEEAMRGYPVVYMPMLNPHRKTDLPSFNLAASVAMVTWEAWRQQQTLLQTDPAAMEAWQAAMDRQKAAEDAAKLAAEQETTASATSCRLAKDV